MTRLGMDVSAMAELVAQFEIATHELASVTSCADVQVRRGVGVWFGGEAELFAHVWSARHRAALSALEADLLGLVGRLRGEIAQQQAASGAHGVLAAFAPDALRAGQSRTYDGGALRITSESTFATTGPRNVMGLTAGLEYRSGNDAGHRAYDYPGGISVLVEGTPPNRHVVVDISGTQSWTAGGKNISDAGGDLANAQGAYTPKEAALQQALLASGVTPQDKIMLVGHSQGGADALAFSHDHADDPRFDVRSVVTVGAPPESKYPPAGVAVLQLKGTGDHVPTLPFIHSGAGPGVSTVGVVDGRFDDPLSAHDPSTYAEHLNEQDPAVAGFEQRQAGFFGGQPATSTVYSNVRTHPNLIEEGVSAAVLPDLSAASAADAWVRRHV